MSEIQLEATLENLNQVQAFIEEQLESSDCSMKTQMQIEMAVEEIYVNIAHYAYTPDTGMVSVLCDVLQDPERVVIRFTDSGTPFDPVGKKDADTTLSAEEREIGGLGILMVKRTMDEMLYEYKDGNNILTLIKNI